MVDFGRRIATLRKARDLTQMDLAQKSKLHYTVIAGLETGHRPNPTINTLIAVATALGVPVAALVEQEDAAKVA